MNETRTLMDEPLIQITENFLTRDECRSLIVASHENLKDSTVINGITGIQEYSSFRTSDNYDLPSDHELTKIVYGRISDKLGIDQSRFEQIEVIKYSVGESFNSHWDFFSSTTEKTHFVKGGQRVGTVILYLNDVESGGETFFPSLRIVEQPVTGKMMYFKYNYDINTNIKTLHKGMPIECGEKWIATVWIRESPRTQLYEDYFMENTLRPLNDAEYELECAIPDDTRILSLKLPNNSEPENTIMVVITPDSSSVLLLYLVIALNFHLSVPYYILPIVVGNLSPDNLDSIHTMIDAIRTRTSSEYILDMEISNQSLDEIFIEKSKDRFYKFSYIFTSNPAKISSYLSDWLVQPFENLSSKHIAWAIDELNISDVV